jgi:carbonic anhydrase
VKYEPIDLQKKKSQALVIHCADPRFQEAYRNVIDKLGLYYDLMVVPGASKAIVEDEDMVSNIKMLHILHDFEEVHILDHVECGAFGPVEDEVEAHSSKLNQAAAAIKQHLPKLKVVPHLLTADHALELS